MLHEVLAQYLARVEQAILRCSTAYVERYTEEILTPRRANLRIRLRFAQGHVLEVNELWRGGRGWPRGAGDGARPSDPGPLWEATQSDAAPSRRGCRWAGQGPPVEAAGRGHGPTSAGSGPQGRQPADSALGGVDPAGTAV
jgi:hypothetical protein